MQPLVEKDILEGDRESDWNTIAQWGNMKILKYECSKEMLIIAMMRLVAQRKLLKATRLYGAKLCLHSVRDWVFHEVDYEYLGILRYRSW